MALDTLTALKKADMAISDLSGGSGLLVAEQADKFFKVPVLKSVALKMFDVKGMKNNTMEVSKVSAMSKILHGAGSGQALSSAQRSKPNVLTKVLLTAQLLRGEVRINDEILEDNVEREAFATTVRDLIGEGVSRDMENLVLNGDTTSSDDLLSVLNGVIKACSSNLVPAGGVQLSKSVLRDVDLTMPHAQRQASSVMRHLTSYKAAIWYRDSLSSRQTIAGDDATLKGYDGETYAPYNGVPVIPIPLFPEDLGSGTDETVVVYCNPKDVIVGYQRQVRIRTKELPESGEVAFYVDLRMDAKLRHEPAFVKATGVVTA